MNIHNLLTGHEPGSVADLYATLEEYRNSATQDEQRAQDRAQSYALYSSCVAPLLYFSNDKLTSPFEHAVVRSKLFATNCL